MSDLIRKDEVKDKVDIMLALFQVPKDLREEAIELFIDNIPIAEPKVRKWLAVKIIDDEADFGETDGAECSECGYTVSSYYWATTYYHHCPNCGAKMMEEEDESN